MASHQPAGPPAPQPNGVILAIDPGSVITGYALLGIEKNKPYLITMGVIKLSSYKNYYERLKVIYQSTVQLVTLHQPTAFAIEAPFYGKNVQSMLKLGRAQGVAIAAAMQTQIEVYEYLPKKVKQSVTGNGNASKEQVWKMLKTTLCLTDKPAYFDSTDALAVGLCHFYQSHSVAKTAKGKNTWDDFLKANPHRIKKLS